MNREVQQSITNEASLEIFEVAIHSIMYIRGIYPEPVFRKRKMYNTTVYLSIYPKLNKYISNMLIYAKELLDLKRLYRVHIVVYECSDGRGTITRQIEQYAFAVSPPDNDEPIDKTVDEYRLEMEKYGRDVLLYLDQNLKDYKSLEGRNAIFKIYLETTETAYIDISQRSKPHVKEQPLYMTEINRDGTKYTPIVNSKLLTVDAYTQTPSWCPKNRPGNVNN